MNTEHQQYEERKTPAGFLVKVRLDKMTYVVFKPMGPEIPKGAKNNSIIVPVPRVVFLGEDFNLSHFRFGEMCFVNVKASKLMIPYHHGNSRETKFILLNSGSESDNLPVIVNHYITVKELIHAAEQGEEFHHIIADESLVKNDMVTLKIRYPNVNILILKKKIITVHDSKVKQDAPREQTNETPVVDAEKARVNDLTDTNLNTHSQNPVFLARVHLRKLELEKVKQLLFDFNLKTEDIDFIRTFLDVMIKNVNGKEDLEEGKEKVKTLDEIFRLANQIINRNEQEFEIELDKGFPKEVAYMLYTLLEKYQSEAVNNVEDEILLWEWKYRARRLM